MKVQGIQDAYEVTGESKVSDLADDATEQEALEAARSFVREHPADKALIWDGDDLKYEIEIDRERKL